VDGAQVVYGGRLGGDDPLIAPADAAGKLVVFSVAPGANGQRPWRFYSLGPLTQYAGAAGIAAAVRRRAGTPPGRSRPSCS